MEFKKIDDSLAVAGQIASGDLPRAAAQGFKTVINVRPDGEQADAMTADQARGAASASALDYHYLPVLPTQITDEDVSAFKALLANADGPVLAHCGTGMRATVLWALANAGSMDTQEILQKAASAGFDLSRVAPRIEQAANARM
ncbi:MAG: TIGR01244 family phosphatase [Rhizobiales bacterium]|nr:TIGR01244 family phosphatase [Hyphomicrobiales bacterium]